ncbi:MAG: histidine phosphatase family protein [Mariniphaga sp.]|nr:histidine phosphatase family protein [Mariniphaga sp.]
MKNLLLIIVLFISLNLAAQEIPVSTYYLIRHAEKVKSENPDPVLHTDGIARAENWAEIFRNVSFDAIYSTNYIRTKETVKPTANKQNIELTIYHPININYGEFKTHTHGKTVLVVGHSNTIPAFVNKLINADKYEMIEENNNSNLYIVQIAGNVVTDQVLYLN